MNFLALLVGAVVIAIIALIITTAVKKSNRDKTPLNNYPPIPTNPTPYPPTLPPVAPVLEDLFTAEVQRASPKKAKVTSAERSVDSDDTYTSRAASYVAPTTYAASTYSDYGSSSSSSDSCSSSSSDSYSSGGGGGSCD
jgi:uncharacterized membrane protein YgcG